MSQVREIKKLLQKGKVYRRADFNKWTGSVDRILAALVQEGTIQKLTTGIYHYPKYSAFGKVPPDEEELISAFLRDNRFLVTSLNSYNSLGIGTTQLYNKKIVYNHKRHGLYQLGNLQFDFRIRRNFPTKLSLEFLVVDLVNNLDQLAEDIPDILERLHTKIGQMDQAIIKKSLDAFGNPKTKRLMLQIFD